MDATRVTLRITKQQTNHNNDYIIMTSIIRMTLTIVTMTRTLVVVAMVQMMIITAWKIIENESDNYNNTNYDIVDTNASNDSHNHHLHHGNNNGTAKGTVAVIVNRLSERY